VSARRPDPLHLRRLAHRLVERPQLARPDGWYYLTVAEGGTGYEHAITMARSPGIEGPYGVDPHGFLLTSKDAAVHRADHCQMADTPDGAAYLTHLCSRPPPGARRSRMRRETALWKCVRSPDGWLRLESGGLVPATATPAPPGNEGGGRTRPDTSAHRRFDGPALSTEFQCRARPIPSAPLSDRIGFVPLRP
jgi:xylan 1,4-beta-xylosidase